MLFNSPVFLFLFLPVTLLVFLTLRQRLPGTLAAMGFLGAASLFFYAWWEPRNLMLLTASMVFNFYASRLLVARRKAGRPAGGWLALFVGINLADLAYFKYANFFLDATAALSGGASPHLTIVLPLAISFFTFQQITFLVDSHRGEAEEPSFILFVLYVTFFPHLIAGPLVHHREMMPQFRDLRRRDETWRDLSVGLTLLAIGLLKKTLLADPMQDWSDRMFGAAAMGAAPSLLEAWLGAVCFALQIYFDFSGYSDMALGLSRMFGVRLPINFDSPYKAVNLIDFWRRWHLTLSRFLRDYLYIPLGGNRHGPWRRHLNLMMVMLLGGLWHGAGWTFVMWGGLHGLYLVFNHGWLELKQRLGWGGFGFWGRWGGRLLTFALVLVAWVFFRAEHFPAARAVIEGMIGRNGVVLPAHYATWMGNVGVWLADHGVVFGLPASYGGGMQLVWVGGLLLFVWLLPNSQELLHGYGPAIEHRLAAPLRGEGRLRLHWRPASWLAAGLGATCAWMTIRLLQGQSGEFIYFQF
ncbi:MAG: MBOAT family protein [Magnetococcales bacterium]|nr:MBOAT family protein [Magnetococcales bacterium]